MATMRITDSKGVQFLFDNGLTISIQIGAGNYCDNYSRRNFEVTPADPLPPSTRAEIAVWDGNDKWLDYHDGDQVKGYVPVEDVLRFTAFLQSLPSDLEIQEVELACRAFDWREVAEA